MKSGIRFIGFAALALALAVLLTGCATKQRTVSYVLNHADDLVDDDVIVAGDVTKVVAVNLVIAEAGAYQIDDGTGKIWVVTKVGVPDEGQPVGVKGTVQRGLRLGGETFGVYLREVERRVK
jgi:hypothetical protein